MRIPTGDLDAFRSGVDRILDDLSRFPDDAALRTPDGASVELLAEALRKLLDVMVRVEADSRIDESERTGRRAGGEDITELGEYGFRLQESLASLVDRTGQAELKEAMAGLIVDLGLWIAAHGGRLDSIEVLVDALALIANRTSQPGSLARLSEVMGHIIEAVSPVIREDLERVNPGRPWRVLLLNRGIVATRSHDPARMEEAFDFLIRHLPEDAPGFFAAGMQQMDALNYPDPVRRVMEKYHRRWTTGRTLH
jgi:hypothetical protein